MCDILNRLSTCKHDIDHRLIAASESVKAGTFAQPSQHPARKQVDKVVGAADLAQLDGGCELLVQAEEVALAVGEGADEAGHRAVRMALG